MLAVLMLPSTTVFSADAEEFSRHAKFSEVVISPNGSYLAISVVNDQRRDLAVVRVSDQALVTQVSPGEGEHAHSLRWVSDTRILVALATSGNYEAAPIPTGELMAIDYDGQNAKYLFGSRGTRPDGDYMADETRHARFAFLTEPMIDDPKYALITSWSFFASPQKRYALSEKLNVYTGQTSGAWLARLIGVNNVVADSTGQVRYAQGKSSRPGVLTTLFRSPTTNTWAPLKSEDPQADFSPLAISQDGLVGYMKVRESTDRFCLEQQILATGERKQLACHPHADLSRVVYAPRSGRAVAAVFEPGRPEVHWLQSGDPEEPVLRQLWNKFPGMAIQITSHSRDGSRIVLRVDSDTNPGEFYLFDREKSELRFLMSRHDQFSSINMPRREVVQWTSVDGQKITGYLTVPAKSTDAPMPLVVMLHGGPFDVRDRWLWQAEPAYLASKGYRVLQPQFRGSAGYGRVFRDAGKKALGTLMVEDIHSGVQSMIRKGLARPEQIGIMGYSAGAHLALMSVSKAPGLYGAAVGISGSYDLVQQRRLMQAQNDVTSVRFFHAFIGQNNDLLREHSPMSHIDKVNIPVLLFHGERDRAVPLSQSENIYDALVARGVRAQLVPFPEETHFIFNEKNRTQLFMQTLKFFDRYLSAKH